MDSNATIKISKNLNSYTQKSHIARELSKEITRINSSRIFTNHNGIGCAYPIVTHFFDFDDITEAGKEFLKSHNCQNNFCFFDKRNSVYKIYIAGHTNDFINKYYNSSEYLKFRGKKINIVDNPFELKKQLSLSLYRHELAHIKISEIENFDKLNYKGVPFQLVNIFEDARVNNYWNSDSKNFRIINSELIKIDKTTLSSSATGYDILFPVFVTMDDPKYAFLSPDYPFVKDIFERAKVASGPQEIVNLCKEFLDEMQKRYPEEKNKFQPNQQNQQNDSQKGNQQSSSQGQRQGNNEKFNEDEEYKRKQNSNSSLQEYNSNKSLSEDYDDDDDNYEDFEEDLDSEELQSNRRKIDDSNQQDGFLQGDDISNNMNDLLNGSLSSQDLDTFETILKRELENKSFAIDQNGNITPPIGLGNSSSKFIYRNRNSNNNNTKDLFPSAKDVSKKCIALDMQLLNHLVYIGKKELGKYFPITQYAPTDMATHKLNTQNLYSVPINPQLKNVFLKKDKPNQKEPIKLSIFQDLSGSMSGYPLNISKHIIAALKGLQDLGFINVTMFLHATHGENICHVVNLGDIKNKALERISDIRTYGSEGIINAVAYAQQKYHTTLKNSRFVLFFTDGCLTDEPHNIKKSLKRLGLDKVAAIYADTYENYHNLNEYFGNNISFKLDNNDDIATRTKKVSELILKTICLLANPDINSQHAVKLLSKDKNIVAQFNKKQFVSENNTYTQTEENNNDVKVKI